MSIRSGIVLRLAFRDNFGYSSLSQPSVDNIKLLNSFLMARALVSYGSLLAFTSVSIIWTSYVFRRPLFNPALQRQRFACPHDSSAFTYSPFASGTKWEVVGCISGFCSGVVDFERIVFDSVVGLDLLCCLVNALHSHCLVVIRSPLSIQHIIYLAPVVCFSHHCP
jgi:hypothetical protein